MKSQIVLGGRFEVFENGQVNKIVNGVSMPAKVSYTCRDHKYATVSYMEKKQQKHVYVHRLVASAFVPNPQHLSQVNHKDGNTRNNSSDNLEWVTASQNVSHAFRTGLSNPMATAIPCEYCGALTKSKSGICPGCQKALKKEALHVDKQAELHDRFSKIDYSALTPTETVYVKCRSEGMTLSEIATRYGVSRQCVSAAILWAERKSSRPIKITKAQEDALLSLRRREKRAETTLTQLRTDLALAEISYASAKKERETFEQSLPQPVLS